MMSIIIDINHVRLSRWTRSVSSHLLKRRVLLELLSETIHTQCYNTGRDSVLHVMKTRDTERNVFNRAFAHRVEWKNPPSVLMFSAKIVPWVGSICLMRDLNLRRTSEVLNRFMNNQTSITCFIKSWYDFTMKHGRHKYRDDRHRRK